MEELERVTGRDARIYSYAGHISTDELENELSPEDEQDASGQHRTTNTEPVQAPSNVKKVLSVGPFLPRAIVGSKE
jgi:hypothetical protein